MTGTKIFISEPDKFRHSQVLLQRAVLKSLFNFSMLRIPNPYGTLFAFSGVSV
jgi:hypothetical protein